MEGGRDRERERIKKLVDSKRQKPLHYLGYL